MQITDVVLGLAAGVGIDLSPDGKTAYYVQWSSGELSRVDTGTGMVTTVRTGLKYPEDVEVDWATGDMFISERTGAVIHMWPGGEKSETLVEPGGAPQQLDLKKGTKRNLYTVCYDSGRLLRIDVASKTTTVIASGLGHPVGIVVDATQKYAYITEQDQRALTRVELSTGTIKRLYTALTSPFFLAWDKFAKGVFCIQRDPANNLVWLPISSPVTLKVIANGLAWRPSGVAPNADNKLIYACTDREVEVISFNGGPIIKTPKPPFIIHSITFNYDKSTAIKLKDHLSGTAIPRPEYVRLLRNRPAAYVAGSLPHIKVVLKKQLGYVSGAYAVGATGNLGGVRPKVITPVFNSSGLSNPIDFELMWPLPHTVGKPDVKLTWYAHKCPGPAIPVAIGSASHRFYLVHAKPTAPWVTETPWVAALERACGWASGATTAEEAATRIATNYYNCGVLQYDVAGGGGTRYGSATYMLSEMLEKLSGGTGLGSKVNCTDSANTVSTLANIIGCDLWQCRMGWSFNLNPILAIGHPNNDPWPTWPGFSYHEVAWKGACTQNEDVFDGCLMVDSDTDPTTAPQTWMLPTDILFGDCTTMTYRLRLCPPGTYGCAACQPQPSTSRQRRPIA